MKQKSIFSSILFSFLLLFILPFGSVSAAASFDWKTDAEEVIIDEEFTVEINGQDLDDIYGYEILLEYDPQYFQFVEADSSLSDQMFHIEGENGNQQILLGTKIGEVSGDNGDLELIKIVFKALKETDGSEMTLKSIKVADSQAESEFYELNKELSLVVTEEKPAEEVPVEEEPVEEEPAVPTAEFTDIDGHWAEAKIGRAVELGMIQGYGDGTFRADNKVSRDEFAVMLQAIQQYDTNPGNVELPADYNSIGPWARDAVIALMGEGILSGYDDGTFRPEQSLRRNELATILAATLDLDVSEWIEPDYKDAEDIPAWAAPSIGAASDAGLLHGRDGGYFMPNETTTRAEAVQVLLTIYDY
ncbi:hypothetical protein F9U64_06635 [Gracilibacillus oryzae]|uniref:SLH domain-containing protein n=1 Tax=Gracilibacillus oryzae TaxID=1672701 RepID=A0A7C8GU90_9BACI|nr:S-layer homology domain-containing protein [Gracilibacillus oryzae]KAB8138115.1 hypothetical protein F9U64_06635 [Gracilibacillus oryzae]